MQFLQVFLLAASILLMLAISVYAFIHRSVKGAFPLFFLVTAGAFWSIATFGEVASTTLPAMLRWRNLQQIGAFSVPLLSLFFAVEYTGQRKLRGLAAAAAAFALISVVLIFTNDFHALLRSGYELHTSPVYGTVLIVKSTPLGLLVVGINFFIPLIAVMILADFRRKIPSHSRQQLTLIIISFALTFTAAWLKTAWLTEAGIHIHISVLYTPSVLLLFYALFRFKLFTLTPIARDIVFHVVKQGILVTDADGSIIDSNSHSRELLRHMGRSLAPGPTGVSISGLLPDFSGIGTMLAAELEQECTISSGDQPRHFLLHSYPLHLSGKTYRIGTVFILQDETTKKNHELELKRTSETDALTGLKNRRSFLQHWEVLMRNVSADSRRFALLMMDLDHFKNINDTYGHTFGDLVLRAFAGVVRESIREVDIAVRLGGEEFGILLAGADSGEAFAAAEKIRLRTAKTPVVSEIGIKVSFTVSIGIADSFLSAATFDGIMHAADLALYEAKRNGRNCSVIYCASGMS